MISALEKSKLSQLGREFAQKQFQMSGQKRTMARVTFDKSPAESEAAYSGDI